MDTNSSSSSTTGLLPGWQRAIEVLKKLVIWGLFFAVVYLARDFFFLAFMTFLFSYMALTVIHWTMNRFWPGKNLPGIRRLITLGVFLCLPVILLIVGIFVMPHLISQAQHVIGWASRINPEVEASRMLEGFVSHAEFDQEFGNPEDPRYQKALADFQKTGERYVKQYLDFPSLDAWVEGGFNKQFADTERNRIRTSLLNEGVSSKAFEEWFITTKYPELKSQARKENNAKSASVVQEDSLIRFAQSATAQESLQKVRHNPGLLASLQQEWINDSVERGIVAAKTAPAYRDQFRKYYEQCRTQKPELAHYTFDQFLTLQNARNHGQLTFSKAMEQFPPLITQPPKTQLITDFETAKKHELFQKWWDTSSPARFIRHEIERNTTGDTTGRMEAMLTALLNIPLDLCSALLLSFLICIDYPAMKQASHRLRETWLKEVYDEIVPALASLAKLVGTAMYAQGLIALCNAVLIFSGLTMIGVDHAALLGLAVFILCLVPTLGTIIAWVLIVIMALVQPGGGLLLAAKATGIVLMVIILETFVLSPRILGRLMELHPVIILAILPVAHSFFGIWGLLLAIPVSVYVINTVILRRKVSEHKQPTELSTDVSVPTQP